jgi:hypothetical protein
MIDTPLSFLALLHLRDPESNSAPPVISIEYCDGIDSIRTYNVSPGMYSVLVSAFPFDVSETIKLESDVVPTAPPCLLPVEDPAYILEQPSSFGYDEHGTNAHIKHNERKHRSSIIPPSTARLPLVSLQV